MEEDDEISKVFLRYAFPCAQIALDKKRISQEKHDELREKFLNNHAMSRNELEKIFPEAFKRLRESSENKKQDYWTKEAIRNYFLNEHNKYIDKNDGTYSLFTPTLKELCRIKTAKVVGFDEKHPNIAIVYASGKEKKVFSDILPNLRKGDKLVIHFAYAVEKV